MFYFLKCFCYNGNPKTLLRNHIKARGKIDLHDFRHVPVKVLTLMSCWNQELSYFASSIEPG